MNAERPRNTTTGCTHQLSTRRVSPKPVRVKGTSMSAIEPPHPLDRNDHSPKPTNDTSRLNLKPRYHTSKIFAAVLETLPASERATRWALTCTRSATLTLARTMVQLR